MEIALAKEDNPSSEGKFKLKIHSMALLKNGSVSIDGTLIYPFEMREDVQLIIDKASWEKLCRNVTHWHAS